ncbi:hypothetical protein [Halomonas casei]|uniref:hypothetical protein n=1 Tax=Halomonas TaxID=2745 RepID=UPI001868CF49|nr:hypothetical protein [Halomonas casei]
MNYLNLYDSVAVDDVDGFFVFYTALLNGMNIQRMPGQLFLITNHKTPDAKTAFVHSVAQSTRLSTTTFVLQKRFRRVLFQQAKIAMPPAATFSFFSKLDPIKYARKIEYPVVAKEMFGENPAYGIYDINNKSELKLAIDKVRRHLPVNSEKAPSSYAQTINLGSAESLDENTRIKSVKSRFLIEKQLKGNLYRAYVIGGNVDLVVEINKESFSQVATFNANVADLAKAAVDAIPGIVNAAVDIVQADDGKCYLVEFSERLLTPHKISNQDELTIFERIFQKQLESELILAGCDISKKRAKVKYSLFISGVTDFESFKSKVKNIMLKFNISVGFLNEDHVLGKLEAEIHGQAENIALSIEEILQEEHASHMSFIRKLFFKK